MAEFAAPVTDTLMEFADTLVSDYDLIDYLERLLEHAAGVLDATAGGVMLTQPGQPHPGLQLLACTDEAVRTLELFELQAQEGPCIDSYRSGLPVVIEDLVKASQWPQFSAVALGHGFAAAYAFPMRLRGQTIGALNLFRRQPGAVAPGDLAAARAFADMATIGIMQQRAVAEARELAGQLQLALHRRLVIEQAKGMVAERKGCELDEAYQLIRRYSRDTNRRLREVAAGIVSGTLRIVELANSGTDPS